jgi:hypothetical protein
MSVKLISVALKSLNTGLNVEATGIILDESGKEDKEAEIKA